MKREELESELKRLIVDALMLKDVTPEQIETTAPLFVEGLGLDSIDALELGMAIEGRWGFKIGGEEEQTRKAFASVRSLADFILAKTAPTTATKSTGAPT